MGNFYVSNNVILTSTVITGGETAPTNQQATTQQPSDTTQTSQQPVQPFGIDPLYSSFLWIGLMLAAMYFFTIRPQKKREKQMREMQESIKVGENVVTSSGFFGKIVSVGHDSFMVEFGENRGVRVWVRKSDILGVKSPVTTPPPLESTEVTTK